MDTDEANHPKSHRATPEVIRVPWIFPRSPSTHLKKNMIYKKVNSLIFSDYFLLFLLDTLVIINIAFYHVLAFFLNVSSDFHFRYSTLFIIILSRKMLLKKCSVRRSTINYYILLTFIEP